MSVRWGRSGTYARMQLWMCFAGNDQKVFNFVGQPTINQKKVNTTSQYSTTVRQNFAFQAKYILLGSLSVTSMP